MKQEEEVSPRQQGEVMSPASPKPWLPGLAWGIALGSLIFWPLSAVGLVAIASRSEKARQQGVVILITGLVGFFWGWKLLAKLFGWGTG